MWGKMETLRSRPRFGFPRAQSLAASPDPSSPVPRPQFRSASLDAERDSRRWRDVREEPTLDLGLGLGALGGASPSNRGAFSAEALNAQGRQQRFKRQWGSPGGQRGRPPQRPSFHHVPARPSATPPPVTTTVTVTVTLAVTVTVAVTVAAASRWRRHRRSGWRTAARRGRSAGLGGH